MNKQFPVSCRREGHHAARAFGTSHMPSILIIDDEEAVRFTLRHHFVARTWDVMEAESAESGIRLAEEFAPDIILLDMRLPDMDGIKALQKLKEHGSFSSVVFMTAWGTISNAVEAIKLGAEQYLTKPVEFVELDSLMDRILETRKLKIENLYYQQRMDHPVIGISKETQKLHRMIDLMAENADTTVLLLGESGTGKELVAREIHRRSERRNRPFLDINCSALTETLLESEMFGHELGAFTDARQLKHGLFEVADGGTVFLDEIGEMPLAVQPKLLRVLETRSFKRLGGTRDIQVNVRIVAATNQDLATAVSGGRFREDLYYRLKVFPVHTPPLRERGDDVPSLAEYFIAQFNAALKKNITGFTPGAMELLNGYAWPGNVRELKNVVERAMVLSKTTVIDRELLPLEIAGIRDMGEPRQEKGTKNDLQKRTLRDLEREHILEVFTTENRNRTTTAKALGISRSTLQEKLKKYGIA